MARLVTCGWETGMVGEVGALGSNAGGGGYAFAVTSSARNGSHALSLQHNKPPGASWYDPGIGTWCNISIPGQPAEIYGRIAVRVVQPLTDGAERFLQLLNGDNAHVRLFMDFNTSGIGLSCGSGSVLRGGALQTVWGECLEFYAKIDPSSGFFQLWDRGSLAINFTGRTQAGSYAPITHVQLCTVVHSASYNNAPRFDFDDLAINDTTGSVNNGRIGQGGIVPLFPTADTADKDFSCSSGSVNWSLINTSPPRGDASYVQGSVAGDRDLYEMQNLSGFGTIAVVGVAGVARAQGGAGAQLTPTILINSTTSAKSAWTLIGTYAPYQTTWEINPETSAAWTGVAVNSLLAGVTIG